MSVTTLPGVVNDSSMTVNAAPGVLSSEISYSNGRLTYTGPTNRHFLVNASTSLQHADTGTRQVQLYLYKNGVPTTAQVGITVENNDQITTLLPLGINMSTGDYIELWMSGSTVMDLELFAINVSILGLLNV